MAVAPLQKTDFEYLIVGCGISGLYCGDQLIKKGIQPNGIQFLERSNRVGGLLKSEIVEINGYKIKQEEGGMRFYKHHRAYQLAVDLGLEHDIVQFKMGGEYNLNYFRGKRFTQDPNDSYLWYQIFNTGIKEPESSPHMELTKVFMEICKENNGTLPQTPEDWQKVRLTWTVPDETAIHPNKHVPLNEWDYEYLLRQRNLSPEAIRMIKNASSGTFDRDINAGFGFQLMLKFDPPEADTKFYTLQHGYDQLPTTLHDNLKRSGVEFKFLAEVVKYFQETGDYPIRVEYAQNGVTKEFRCKNLILAIPKLALVKLAKTNEQMNQRPNFEYHVNSVISRSIVKINLYFENQWWLDLNITDGPNNTDLSLGSVYPFVPIPSDVTPALAQGDNPSNWPGSFTIYCDYANSFYWRSLQMTGGVYEPITKCKVRNPDPLPDSVPASDMLVRVALDQLKLLFQRPNIGIHFDPNDTSPEIIPEKPVYATFTHWVDETYGDSIHAWRVGIDDSVVSPDMYGLLGDNIAIIGESYSIAQHWVEGSLNHTEGFINQHFRKM